MNKKIRLGIVAMFVIAFTVVYAKYNVNEVCPDKPGCICSGKPNVKIEKQLDAKGACPNTPDCICK